MRYPDHQARGLLAQQAQNKPPVSVTFVNERGVTGPQRHQDQSISPLKTGNGTTDFHPNATWLTSSCLTSLCFRLQGT